MKWYKLSFSIRHLRKVAARTRGVDTHSKFAGKTSV